MVPETIAGVQTTVAVLAEICHQYFLNAKVENNKTVKQNLDLVMTNLLSGLTFKSPKTRCVNHSQCGTWYNTKVLAIHKHKTVARCVEQNRQEAMYTCALRGGAGANCTVMKDGKRLSSGLFEYPCEPGLTCKIVHTGGYFQNWELWDDYVGECRR